MIRANAWRKNKVHLMVFFIFLVANMGGCLTPLGDPPLFMGFQRGVPFTWTFHLLPILLLNLVIMFAIFAVMDKHFYNKEIKEAARLMTRWPPAVKNRSASKGLII